MPPDADKLRQRKGATPVDEPILLTPPTLTDPVEQSAAPLLKGHEMSIEGVIYDISDFDHPGGDTIKIFGGNDVTAHYKMIHPYHTSKHLEKLKQVGQVPNYKPEYVTVGFWIGWTWSASWPMIYSPFLTHPIPS